MALPTSWFQPSETDFRLLPSKTVREHISVVLSHQVPGNWLQQPQERNPVCVRIREALA